MAETKLSKEERAISFFMKDVIVSLTVIGQEAGINESVIHLACDRLNKSRDRYISQAFDNATKERFL